MTITWTKLSKNLLENDGKTTDTFRVENCGSELKENMCLFYYILLTPSQCVLQESGRGFNKYRKKGSSGTKQGAAKVKVETTAKQGSSRGRGKRKRWEADLLAQLDNGPDSIDSFLPCVFHFIADLLKEHVISFNWSRFSLMSGGTHIHQYIIHGWRVLVNIVSFCCITVFYC